MFWHHRRRIVISSLEKSVVLVFVLRYENGLVHSWEDVKWLPNSKEKSFYYPSFVYCYSLLRTYLTDQSGVIWYLTNKANILFYIVCNADDVVIIGCNMVLRIHANCIFPIFFPFLSFSYGALLYNVLLTFERSTVKYHIFLWSIWYFSNFR